MAQHIEIKNGGIKKHMKSILNSFFDDYGNLKAIKSGNDYYIYNYKGIRFVEGKDKPSSTELNRVSITMPRNKMKPTHSKWLDDTFFGGEKYPTFSFDFYKTGRSWKLYLVA